MQGAKVGKWLRIQEDRMFGMKARGFCSIRTGLSMAIALVTILPVGVEATELVVPSRGGVDERSTSLIPAEGGIPSLQLALRLRKPRDTDEDGVPDRDDECQDTPAGALVDARGCPKDEDADGIFDGIDQCRETPRGATVDTAGCPRDSDADGILDGLDLCPDTDPATLVKEDGCSYDTDSDGVLEGIDRCAATPTGAVVDQRGCPVDTDGDGVPDGLDECPETSLEEETDASGCSRVQRGEFVFPTIRFRLGSRTIAPGSSPALDEVADILRQNPDLTVEIGGHTDNEGPARLNRKISLQRAEAVRAYLVSLGVSSSRLLTKGYGEVHPIATNRTSEGRARNRRIEFTVLTP
jgi:OOP family OmpA-OmpF porin